MVAEPGYGGVLVDGALTVEALIAFLTLALLEIVLGIDNIVFLSTVTGRLPREQQRPAQRIGLLLALGGRLALLFSLSWVMRLTSPLFEAFGHEFSAQDVLLVAGGLFLIVKATREVYHKTEGMDETHDTAARATASFGGALVQILVMDLIFSLDSIFTALGMTSHIWVIVAAIVAAVVVMMVFAGPVSDFINEHASLKILALSFLLLIGVLLVAEGTGTEFERGYVYFAMGFSLLVELLQWRYDRNLRRRARGGAVAAKSVAAVDSE